MPDFAAPEMLNVPLQETCLQILALGLGPALPLATPSLHPVTSTGLSVVRWLALSCPGVGCLAAARSGL